MNESTCEFFKYIQRAVMVAGMTAMLVVTAATTNGQTASETAVTTDWPQWRGANRDDVSTETGLLQSWPDGGPASLWVSSDGGAGYAGFAIVGDRLYTLGADSGNEFAICLNASDGTVVWKQNIDEQFVNRWGDGPRNTPTVDGGNLYVLSARGTLVCLGTSDGSVTWTKSLTGDLGGSTPFWGYSESVLVDGEQVVCTPGGSEGAMVALNKSSGDIIWQSRLFTDDAHYSSIIVAEETGEIEEEEPFKRHYVQLVEKAVVGIDPENGNLLWREAWPGKTAVIPTPIYTDKKVYVTSGYGAGSMLVNISDLENVNQIWSQKMMTNHHGGVILVDGHIYGHSDKSGWSCQNLETGKIVWNEKDALGKGAIGYADGRFYLLEEKTGTVVLIEATTDGWNELSRFTLDPQSESRKPAGAIWVHPTISNGRLYLRDQEKIYCYDVSANE